MSAISGNTVSAVVIGAGPGGFGLLFAARRAGLLPQLRSAGLCILERGDAPGAGEIGRYDIRSDSHADSFLKTIDHDAQPDLRHLLDRPCGARLHAQRGGAVELNLVGNMLSEAAVEFHAELKRSGWDPIVTGVEAVYAQRQPGGDWITFCRKAGAPIQRRSRTLVMATGAHQPIDRLYQEPIAGLPLLPRFAGKTLQSGELLGPEGRSTWARYTAGRSSPQVVIVGGSHSALASAHWCLHRSGCQRFGPQAVTILHRGTMRLTYASVEAAHADGYTQFDSEDICPKSGRVFPLAGFRSDSRELLRRQWGMGGLTPDDRLRLQRLDSSADQDATRLLEEADLIVAALGYRPRALRLMDEHGLRLSLQAEVGGGPLVDDRSRVLDAGGQPIAGVFGIGLSAGYPLAGIHGEPSFVGEANGLALWQSEIGAQIVHQMLASGHAREHVRAASRAG